MEDKKNPTNPLLIVGITVLCVLLLVFLIFYFDWWRDNEPYMPLRPIFI
jgi:ABC-type transporter Mla subunit MlaD